MRRPSYGGDWNPAALAIIRKHAREGASLGFLGGLCDREEEEIDLALWALLGRSPEQAADMLNGGVIRVSA